MLANSQPLANELFTPTNIAGVAIATTAVNVATNALYQLAKLPQRWTAFIAALAIAYIVVFMSSAPPWYEWILAFFNACLLYCSALGANQMANMSTSSRGSGFAAPQGFFASWLK
jgi:hypothetical protein